MVVARPTTRFEASLVGAGVGLVDGEGEGDGTGLSVAFDGVGLVLLGC